MVVKGRVRWFDATKGRGFVVSQEVDGDILLLDRTLRASRVGSVAEKAWIVVRIEETPRGWHAVEVLDIEQSGAKELAAHAESLEPAVVKWFDRPKGYGFVRVYGRREDVYLHMETLRAWGFAEVKEGDAIAVRVAQTARGLAVSEVRSWNYAIRPRGRRRPTNRPIVLPTGRFAQRVAEDLHLRALIAVLEMLSADARSGLHRGL